MLRIENLTFTYPKQPVPTVSDFSLELPSGGIYGLLGRNGVGKSTLLYLICGLLTPKNGKVTYKGVDTRKRLPETLAEIMIVPEEFSLPNVRMSQYAKLNATFYPKFSYEDLRRHLTTFDLDPDLNLGALSMGQKKKAYMCFALACNTSLLLMDEPTNGLDIPGKSTFRRFIASEMTDERTVIISTHQVRDIDKILDHVVIIDNHSVLLNQPVMEIVKHLSFYTTNDREKIEQALYRLPALEGTSVIMPNLDDDDTEINLETLFDFAITNPEEINRQFKNR